MSFRKKPIFFKLLYDLGSLAHCLRKIPSLHYKIQHFIHSIWDSILNFTIRCRVCIESTKKKKIIIFYMRFTTEHKGIRRCGSDLFMHCKCMCAFSLKKKNKKINKTNCLQPRPARRYKREASKHPFSSIFFTLGNLSFGPLFSNRERKKFNRFK